MDFKQWWSRYKKENYTGLDYATLDCETPTRGEMKAAKAAFEYAKNLTNRQSRAARCCVLCVNWDNNEGCALDSPPA